MSRMPVKTVSSVRASSTVASIVRVAQPTVSPASQSQYWRRSAMRVT